MTSVVSDSTSRPRSMDISSLSPEILLSIFLKFNSEEIVNFRRISKQWLDVIDSNKLLWRSLEWIGKGGESIEKAVEMFDQKSASTLEMVSVEEVKYWTNLQQLVAVIGRSKESIKSISILTARPQDIMDQITELATSSPNLERLVLWPSYEIFKQVLPLTRLISSGKRIDAGSSAGRLKVLWIFSFSNEKTKQILLLPTQFFKSTISFALHRAENFREDFQGIRPLLAKFSATIVHLRLTIKGGESQIEQPLFCPNLKILEGYFESDLSLYFDCPNLKHLILSLTLDCGLQRTPSSVEQLWLKSYAQEFTDDLWEPLLSSCPRMDVLRLKKSESSRRDTNLQPEALVQMLEKRQQMINKGEQIQGLRIVPLQELVLPLEILSKDQIERARKSAGEVIDVKDYPDFIELKY